MPLNPNQRMVSWLEQAWMERYIERLLRPEEIEWFEGYLIDKPELLHMLSMDLTMRDAAHLAVGPPAFVVKELPASERPELVRSVAPFRQTHRWMAAIAASAAIAFASGFLVRSVALPKEEALVANPTRLVMDISRGGPQEAIVDNASGSSDLVVVDAIVPVGATYVGVRCPGLPDRQLNVSRDGVATFVLHRRDFAFARGWSLLVKTGGGDFERRLPMDKLNPRGNIR